MNVRLSQVQNGSVLIIVLWVAIGLVTVALYFAHAMSFELQASANTVAATEADMAIEGAARYVSNILANTQAGTLPQNLHCTNIAVGNAHFWIIGRATNELLTTLQEPAWGLVDEASKININATNVTYAVLTNLPNVTSDLADAIVDWRSTSATNNSISANYSSMQPPYSDKHGPFNTLDELRMVYGMDLATLYGEDANLNGFLDPNEDDADTLPPLDNRDGHLDSGLLEYLTIYSREPNTDTNGNPRVNIATPAGRTQLQNLLQQQSIPRGSVATIAQSATRPRPVTSVLEFYIRNNGKLSALDFAAIEPGITTSSSNMLHGLININTASEQVLACIPGIGSNNAPAVVSYRESNPNRLNSIAWLTEAMAITTQNVNQIGSYITSRSYQFTADIAAVGSYGRGYRRVKFIFDTSEGLPKIIYRQDLTHLGWALGPMAREVAATL